MSFQAELGAYPTYLQVLPADPTRARVGDTSDEGENWSYHQDPEAALLHNLKRCGIGLEVRKSRSCSSLCLLTFSNT